LLTVVSIFPTHSNPDEDIEKILKRPLYLHAFDINFKPKEWDSEELRNVLVKLENQEPVVSTRSYTPEKSTQKKRGKTPSHLLDSKSPKKQKPLSMSKIAIASRKNRARKKLRMEKDLEYAAQQRAADRKRYLRFVEKQKEQAIKEKKSTRKF
tara:strand:- start:60172 stop:60630 length:459 start_codon:yes stop_codon:yes gene_type:complete